VLYLAADLKRHGADVAVFDGTFRTPSDFDALVARRRPPIVGIAANLMTKRQALRMIASSRACGAQVIVGGPDPPYHAEDYLAAGADVVVIGEGEVTLRELLPILARGARPDALHGVAGITFRDEDGTVVRTPSRPLLPDLDALPWPDREAVDVPAYLAAWRARHGFGVVSLITARGCPYTCTWCSRSVFGESHRRRSPAHVADEVAAICDRYGPERLWYADDVFGIHRGWTLAYAAELERRRIRRPFECISRAERIDDEVADAFVSLGCTRVWIGSESGSQRILDAMRRKVTVERVREAAARLRRRGIEVGMFIMLGFDGESFDDLRATVDHLKRTDPDVFLTTVSYPIKGTPYYERVADRLRRPGAWADTTDRDLVIGGRPKPRYYTFARRWMASEVARHRHWRDGRYGRAVRSASSALVGRVGMALTEGWRER
jgi:radical SAM superfamily enzyme YgiQ (UPF0313 family)